jgi:hypothetical protein
MSIDDLLNQPLAPVRDDGFAVSIVRRLRAGEQRMRLVMWGLLAAGFLPVLAVLPFLDFGIYVPPQTLQFLNSQVAPPLVILLLLFVWKARFSRL